MSGFSSALRSATAAFRQATLTARPQPTSASSSQYRLLSTSPVCHQRPGPGKMKTHQGAKKRFRPISKARSRPTTDMKPYLSEFLRANNLSPTGAPLISFAGERTPSAKLIPGKNQNQLLVPGSALITKARLDRGRGSRPGPLFKRGQTGKRHINVRMSSSRLNRLGQPKIVGSGRWAWHMRKLLAPII